MAFAEETTKKPSRKRKGKSKKEENKRQAAVKANRKGEFNLPSFLDEEKAALPSDTDLPEAEETEGQEEIRPAPMRTWNFRFTDLSRRQ